ncbi:hypothetical protein BI347_21950 [Chromobacterium sphagni]|uniref:Uncharacterized protein n=1 Tax=Chromobacterium sphagni TaxID=1903179 RepID=A0A1S1WTX9_9NEIS|nr:hypothetical protein BI347_21950 [Chromobacterium sphagni]OHX20036.1 hypothetical protein BI344_15405 [Chromobacterium sphagni]
MFKSIAYCCLAIATLLPAGGAAAASELDAARAWYWQHPYQPEAINRLALQLVKAGSVGSAIVLLERAARIAPDREDIQANLLRLKSGSRRVANEPWAEAANPSAEATVGAPIGQQALPAPWPLAEVKP